MSGKTSWEVLTLRAVEAKVRGVGGSENSVFREQERGMGNPGLKKSTNVGLGVHGGQGALNQALTRVAAASVASPSSFVEGHWSPWEPVGFFPSLGLAPSCQVSPVHTRQGCLQGQESSFPVGLCPSSTQPGPHPRVHCADGQRLLSCSADRGFEAPPQCGEWGLWITQAAW